MLSFTETRRCLQKERLKIFGQIPRITSSKSAKIYLFYCLQTIILQSQLFFFEFTGNVQKHFKGYRRK